MKKYHYFVLFLIILIAIFFYCYNLRHTYFFSGDMARDSLQALRILKNKEITMIGPPLSFGQFGLREIYFGSLTYYFGTLGLLLTKNNVLGPIYTNILIMIIGLIFFFKLALMYFKKPNKALITTFLYGLSPAIIIHLRFYWNPNFLITIAPIFWYFYYQVKYQKNKGWLFPFFTGLVGAILINLHYFVAPIILLIFFVLLKSQKEKKISFIYLLGLVVGLLPLLLFELKNNFYLTQAIFFNLVKNHSYRYAYQPIFAQTWYIKLANLFRIILIFLGLDYEATYIPILHEFNFLTKIFLGILFFLISLYFIYKKKIRLEKDFIIYLISCGLITTALSHEKFYLRYFFICLPLFVLVLYKIFNQIFLIILVSIFFILINIRILYFQIHVFNDKCPFPTVDQIKKAAVFIKNDKPKLPYNVTENFIGDARALYLRFFLERDTNIPSANDQLKYDNLNTLYVFAPSLDIVYQEKRWEFGATPNLKLTKTYKIDKGYYLYRFSRE